MIWATNDVVSVLVFLLPGLVGSATFYSLTSHPKPNEFGNDDCFVVLHFHDGRRLYGWPEELPSLPSGGHFIVDEGEWLVDDDRFPVESNSVMLISANDVRMVEFVEAEYSHR